MPVATRDRSKKEGTNNNNNNNKGLLVAFNGSLL
jgi:hypothetical protein